MSYPITLPHTPTNVIFTGVAGTGKTYRLLQIQRLYDEEITLNNETVKQSIVGEHSWREVICALFIIEDRMMSVAEMMRHPLIQDKMQANNRRENVTQTLWNCLGTHSHPESSTVSFANRSANYYFDKNSDNRWYLLDEVTDELKDSLTDLIHLYDGRLHDGCLQDDRLHDEHLNQGENKLATTTHANTTSQVESCFKSDYISRSCLVSFHQSYGYDEFVEGIRPNVDPKTGQMRYHIQSGAFLQLCRRAQADPQHRYAMLIDEINRANTAQVFGELMSVIEPDKRAGEASQMQVTLAYSGQRISIPSNVDIYATMNTQDHSLSALDDAFRRRFEFVNMPPDASMLNVIYDDSDNEVDLAKLMTAINERIAVLIGTDAQLGQSYFINITSVAALAKRFALQILPQLRHKIERGAHMQTQAQLLWQILYGVSKESLTHTSGYLLEQPNFAANSTSPNKELSTMNLQGGQSYLAQQSPSFTQQHRSDIPSIAQNLLALVSYIESQDSSARVDIKVIDSINHELDMDILVYLKASTYQRLYEF